MGFFDNLKSGFAFNRMAKAYKEVLDLLNAYNVFRDICYVYKAAWIFYHCIIEAIVKWKWDIFARIMIPDYPLFGRISVVKINGIILEMIKQIYQNLTPHEQDIIKKVLNGETIQEVDVLISPSLKERLLP